MLVEVGVVDHVHAHVELLGEEHVEEEEALVLVVAVERLGEAARLIVDAAELPTEICDGRSVEVFLIIVVDLDLVPHICLAVQHVSKALDGVHLAALEFDGW